MRTAFRVRARPHLQLRFPPRPQIDFSSLKRNRHVSGSDEYAKLLVQYDEEIASLRAEVEAMQPNMRASELYKDANTRLKETQGELSRMLQAADEATEAFEAVKRERRSRFMACFNAMRKHVEPIYKALTRSRRHPTGGAAYLNVDEDDVRGPPHPPHPLSPGRCNAPLAAQEPYLTGIRYNAIPPTKQFRDMAQLSGGEQTVAALALLFAIHRYQPSPFFVLDEIDAALDADNVGKVARYIRERCQQAPSLQCIVISLKDSFFDKADALVGVYRDQEAQASGILTLDLGPFAGSRRQSRPGTGARPADSAERDPALQFSNLNDTDSVTGTDDGSATELSRPGRNGRRRRSILASLAEVEGASQSDAASAASPPGSAASTPSRKRDRRTRAR